MKISLFLKTFLFTSIYLTITVSASHSLDAPTLVKDINLLPIAPDFGTGKVIGTKLIFPYNSAEYGYEPHVLDLTTGQFSLLSDIAPGVSSSLSSFGEFVSINGNRVLFTGCPDVANCELWITDGTTAGTQILKDIEPGPIGSYPQNIVATSNNKVFFTAYTQAAGVEPWITDGTLAGTYQIADFNPGVASSDVSGVTVSSTFVFFAGNDGVTGSEPYFYNASTINTIVSMGDINVGAGSSSPQEFYLPVGGASVYFSASVPATGREPYQSDGSPGSFTLLADVVAGAADSNPTSFGSVGGSTVLFIAGSGVVLDYDLWKSNGTPLGTSKLVELPTYYDLRTATVAGTKYVFTLANGTQLWSSDGTLVGTGQLVPINAPTAFKFLGIASSRILLSASTLNNGTEIWASNGTAIGTYLIKDLVTGDGSSDPLEIDAKGSPTGYFGAFFGVAPALQFGIYSTEGGLDNATLKATIPLGLGSQGSNIQLPMNFGSKVFFTADDGLTGSEPWITDGSEAGTILLKDIKVGADGSGVSSANSTISLNKIFFRADSLAEGTEVYSCDGTPGGTILLNDIEAGAGASSPTFISGVAFNGQQYFTAFNTASGRELYRTDGTQAGTVLAADIRAGSGSGLSTQGIVDGLVVYFAGSLNNTTGTELLKSDGTVGGTILVKDIRVGNQSSSPSDFASLGNGKTIFTADTGSGVGETGRELWVTDGTDAGTVLLKDIRSGSGSSAISGITVINSIAFFAANDNVNGLELWRTDGTPAGTFMVLDINPGAASSGINTVTKFGTKIAFIARTATAGDELWISDGTQVGTYLVKDLQTGIGHSLIGSSNAITVMGSTIFFAGSSAEEGRELWMTDGTAVGTTLAANLVPGSTSSNVKRVIYNEPTGTLYFTADPSTTGDELYKIVVDKCVSDPNKLELGICGCGVVDVDNNGNSQADCLDAGTSFVPTSPTAKVAKNGSVTFDAPIISGATAYEFLLRYKVGKKSKKIIFRSINKKVKKRFKQIKKGTVVSYQVRGVIGNEFTKYSKAKKFVAK